MSGPDVHLHPEAVSEARAAYAWYAARSALAAAFFLAELDDAVARVQESPDAWSTYVEATRRYLLRRFPYFVVYRVSPGRVEILAVAHARRRPGYWRGRE